MSIVLVGSTSGSVTLQEPAVSGSTVIDLPATSGTMVVTGGAQTVQFAAGSASTPSITFTGDTNTGIFSPGADTIAFTEGGAEAMRIDSSGNVGIGTSSPGYRLDVQSAQATVNATSTTGTNATFFRASNTGGYFFAGRDNSTGSNFGTAYAAVLWANGAYPMIFAANDAERMRITSGGKLLVGATGLWNNNDSGGIYWTSATASGGEGGFEFQNTSTSTNSDPNPALQVLKGSTTYTSSQRFIQFYANAGSQPMGGIVGNGATNVQFVSLSDVREKENIEPIMGSLNKIIALNPVEFDWKNTGEHIDAGFVAQEVEQVFPEYVVDNVANAGQEERKGLTGGMSAGFVAHLVKAIQEQQAIITDLKARIETLENK